MSVQNFLNQAKAHFGRRAFREAYEASLLALKEDERAAEAYFILAQIAIEHQNFAKGAELLAQAIGLEPVQARYQAHFARCQIALKREVEASAALTVAIAAAPQDALTLDTIGATLSHLGRHQEAAPWFERAVAVEPGNHSFLHNLGVARQFLGDFAGAEQCFRAELDFAPEGRRPYAALVHLARQTRESNFISNLEAQFDAADADVNARLQLGHALSKTYDDLGEYERSLDWLMRAKEGKRRAVGDMTGHASELFEAAKEAFANSAGGGAPDPAPIFVIGMPRTGTTLLDRVLSSHPDVASAGELNHIPRLSTEMAMAKTQPPYSDLGLMRTLAAVDMAELGRAYLEAARPSALGRPRFIDKMPVNFIYAGLVHQALPNARIICLRRHPLDVVVSNYRQIFNAEAAHYWYSYDLAWTARYYVLFDQLIAHWRARLPPDRFTEVHYEAMVGDLETEARRLLDFCGLDWDARCLAFHENETPVATASSVQVRSPLYASSIGRWKRYGEKLDVAKGILSSAGLI
jgi:tetratricopeptide (TPR) repeat protein